MPTWIGLTLCLEDTEGIAEGEKDLVKAVQMLRANYTDDEILADGISQHTLELAKKIQ